jgi:hypothetical protein
LGLCNLARLASVTVKTPKIEFKRLQATVTQARSLGFFARQATVLQSILARMHALRRDGGWRAWSCLGESICLELYLLVNHLGFLRSILSQGTLVSRHMGTLLDFHDGFRLLEMFCSFPRQLQSWQQYRKLMATLPGARNTDSRLLGQLESHKRALRKAVVDLIMVLLLVAPMSFRLRLTTQWLIAMCGMTSSGLGLQQQYASALLHQ